MKTIVVIGALLLAQASISGCTAQTVPSDWNTDCVGRIQISLPGEADVAADTAKSWKEQNDRVSRFPDDQVASWSSSSFLGQLKISHLRTSDELEKTIQHYLESRNKFRPGGEDENRVLATAIPVNSPLDALGISEQVLRNVRPTTRYGGAVPAHATDRRLC